MQLFYQSNISFHYINLSRQQNQFIHTFYFMSYHLFLCAVILERNSNILDILRELRADSSLESNYWNTVKSWICHPSHLKLSLQSFSNHPKQSKRKIFSNLLPNLQIIHSICLEFPCYIIWYFPTSYLITIDRIHPPQNTVSLSYFERFMRIFSRKRLILVRYETRLVDYI